MLIPRSCILAGYSLYSYIFASIKKYSSRSPCYPFYNVLFPPITFISLSIQNTLSVYLNILNTNSRDHSCKSGLCNSFPCSKIVFFVFYICWNSSRQNRILFSICFSQKDCPFLNLNLYVAFQKNRANQVPTFRNQNSTFFRATHNGSLQRPRVVCNTISLSVKIFHVQRYYLFIRSEADAFSIYSNLIFSIRFQIINREHISRTVCSIFLIIQIN